MNLVVKGADFSSVAIGKIDMKIQRAAGLGACMIHNTNGSVLFMGSEYPTAAVFVYPIQGGIDKLNINAWGTQYRASICFYSGTMPTTTGGAIVAQTSESVASINSGISVVGSPIVMTASAGMYVFEDVDVPSGATFVAIYAGPTDASHAAAYAEVSM